MDIEQRIFELLGEGKPGDEIVDAVMDEFGVDRDEAISLGHKVIRTRGTPNLEEARRAIERLGRIRFV
jgi:hypothetical protein